MGKRKVLREIEPNDCYMRLPRGTSGHFTFIFIFKLFTPSRMEVICHFAHSRRFILKMKHLMKHRSHGFIFHVKWLTPFGLLFDTLCYTIFAHKKSGWQIDRIIVCMQTFKPQRGLPLPQIILRTVALQTYRKIILYSINHFSWWNNLKTKLNFFSKLKSQEDLIMLTVVS